MDKRKVIKVVNKSKSEKGLIQPSDIKIFLYCDENRKEFEYTKHLKSQINESKTAGQLRGILELKTEIDLAECPVCGNPHAWVKREIKVKIDHKHGAYFMGNE